MKRLNIGLSASLDKSMVCVNEDYLNALWGAGANPSVLSPRTDEDYIKEVAESFDGFVFCGGADIDPKYYGEDIDGAENICSSRDEFERILFNAVHATGKPILGICRGMQVINVFLGGSLYQHIDGHVQEQQRSVRSHFVSLIEDTCLHIIIEKENIEVNSFHHQVVKVLANGLAVDAVSEDGYIEAYHALEHPFLLCVQWHPESYYDYCETSKKIFKAFLEACENKQIGI